MSLFSALDINASGLTAQRRRIEVISSNLANANTTRTAEGTPYKRKDLVFESAPVSDVLYPNVSPIEEMVNLLSATRSFEANVQSMNAIKELARKSLEIGK